MLEGVGTSKADPGIFEVGLLCFFAAVRYGKN